MTLHNFLLCINRFLVELQPEGPFLLMERIFKLMRYVCFSQILIRGCKIGGLSNRKKWIVFGWVRLTWVSASTAHICSKHIYHICVDILCISGQYVYQERNKRQIQLKGKNFSLPRRRHWFDSCYPPKIYYNLYHNYIT